MLYIIIIKKMGLYLVKPCRIFFSGFSYYRKFSISQELQIVFFISKDINNKTQKCLVSSEFFSQVYKLSLLSYVW